MSRGNETLSTTGSKAHEAGDERPMSRATCVHFAMALSLFLSELDEAVFVYSILSVSSVCAFPYCVIILSHAIVFQCGLLLSQLYSFALQAQICDAYV